MLVSFLIKILGLEIVGWAYKIECFVVGSQEIVDRMVEMVICFSSEDVRHWSSIARLKITLRWKVKCIVGNRPSVCVWASLGVQ